MKFAISSRWLIVLSDLHLGNASCGTLDEFESDQEFFRLLHDVIPNDVGWPATICLNGDFVDFTRLLVPQRAEERVTAEELSVCRLIAAAEAHSLVFDSLREFVQNDGQIILVPGNHDADFLWDGVFRALQSIVAPGRPQSVIRADECRILDRGLLIEHGHQLTWDNSYRHWPDPFIRDRSSQRLEIPWGSRFMEVIYRQLPDFQPYVYSVLDQRVAARLIADSLFDRDGIARRVLLRMLPFFVRTLPEQIWRHLRSAFPPQSDPVPADVIIRGHTHIAEDRQIRMGTAPVRLLNPGSWLPRLAIDSDRRWRFSELRNSPRWKHHGYIVVDRDDLAATRLCELTTAGS